MMTLDEIKITRLQEQLAAANARAEQAEKIAAQALGELSKKGDVLILRRHLTEAQAELARVRRALQKIDAVALNLAQGLNDTLGGKLLTTVSIGVIRVITTAQLAALEQVTK